MQFFAANRFLAKREEAKLSDHKASATPGDANNRDKGEQPNQPPAQAHEDAAEDEPDKITNCTHHLLS